MIANRSKAMDTTNATEQTNDVIATTEKKGDAKARIRKIKAAARAQRKAEGEDEGTRKIGDKSTKQIKIEVRDLLDELRSAKTTDDKKRIRRALRARGHRGGLGGRKGYVINKEVKKGRRATKQVLGDMTENDAVAA